MNSQISPHKIYACPNSIIMTAMSNQVQILSTSSNPQWTKTTVWAFVKVDLLICLEIRTKQSGGIIFSQ